LRIRPTAPLRWWPVLALQGVLDTGGFLFLFVGSAGQDPEVAAVTGSCFGAVTTLLAWGILKERITPLQWCGIVLVFFCVAVLAGQG
jgi:drug/metabolite transporter (DMT)-like permease